MYWISTKPEPWSNLVNFKWTHIVNNAHPTSPRLIIRYFILSYRFKIPSMIKLVTDLSLTSPGTKIKKQRTQESTIYACSLFVYAKRNLWFYSKLIQCLDICINPHLYSGENISLLLEKASLSELTIPLITPSGYLKNNLKEDYAITKIRNSNLGP